MIKELLMRMRTGKIVKTSVWCSLALLVVLSSAKANLPVNDDWSNDASDIVQNAKLSDGIYSMASSVPEPVTLAVLIVGALAATGARARQRRSKNLR